MHSTGQPLPLNFAGGVLEKLPEAELGCRTLNLFFFRVEAVTGVHYLLGCFQVRLGEVESILKEADSVEASLHQADLRTAVAVLPLLPPVHELLKQIGTTLHQVRHSHFALLFPECACRQTKVAETCFPGGLVLCTARYVCSFFTACQVRKEYEVLTANAAGTASDLPAVAPAPATTPSGPAQRTTRSAGASGYQRGVQQPKHKGGGDAKKGKERGVGNAVPSTAGGRGDLGAPGEGEPARQQGEQRPAAIPVKSAWNKAPAAAVAREGGESAVSNKSS